MSDLSRTRAEVRSPPLCEDGLKRWNAAVGESVIDGDLVVFHLQGPGPRLLWIHGYTLDSSLWAPLWQRLPGYSHFGLDLPGHGRTRRAIPAGASLSAMADAVDVVARHWDVDLMVGLSFGATVALHTALRCPERWRGLLLAALALPGGPQDREAADCHLELLRLAGARGAGPWLADRWLQVPPRIFEGVARDPNLFAKIAEVVRRHSWAELFSDGLSAMGSSAPRAGALAALSMPVELLVGEDDMPAFQRAAQLVRRAVVHARCSYAQGRGHLPLLESPDEGAVWVEQALIRVLGQGDGRKPCPSLDYVRTTGSVD